MKRTSKIVTALLLLCTIAVGLLPARAVAANDEEIWNIVLVVDASQSLMKGDNGEKGSDPDGLRYEAIGSLLASLNSRLAEVGAVVFTAPDSRYENGADYESMKTGTVSVPLQPIKTINERESLIERIRTADEEEVPRGKNQTDIGTALRVAAETLAARNDGRPCAVFLFTDGNSDVNPYSAQPKASRENKQEAVKIMRNNNMLFYGVFLNTNGKGNEDEVSTIVRQVNGTTELYHEITSPRDCMESTDKFLTALGYDTIREAADEIIYESVTKKLEIPGIGVDEISIRFTSQADNTALDDVLRSVSFESPDGYAGAKEYLSLDGRYRSVYKLERSKIEEKGHTWIGEWKIHIEMVSPKVGLKYEPLFTSSVSAQIEPEQVTGLHYGDRLQLIGRIKEASTQEEYTGYTCTLQLVTPVGEERIPLSYDDNVNGFAYELGLTYGAYTACMEFDCTLLDTFKTRALDWKVKNLPPEFMTLPVLRFSIFNPGSWNKTVDLRDYVVDEECDTLRFELVRDSSGLDLDTNGLLRVHAFQFGSAEELFGADNEGNVKVQVTDARGLTSVSILRVRSGGSALIWQAIGVALVLLLLIVIAVMWSINRKNRMLPKGVCTAHVSLRLDGGEASAKLFLPAPGTTGEVRRKTTLYTMLHTVLKDEYVDGVSRQDLEPIRKAVEKKRSALLDVPVTLIKYKGNRKQNRETMLVPLVTQGDGKKNALYNNSVNITIDDLSISLGYSDKDEAFMGDDGADHSSDLDFSYDYGSEDPDPSYARYDKADEGEIDGAFSAKDADFDF